MANQHKKSLAVWLRNLAQVFFLYVLALTATVYLPNGARAQSQNDHVEETWQTEDDATNIYIRSLIEAFDVDNDAALSRQELSSLLDKMSCWENNDSNVEHHPATKEGVHVSENLISIQDEGREIMSPYNGVKSGSVICLEADWMNRTQCLTKKCLNLDDIWQIFIRDGASHVDGLTLRNMLPAVFYQCLNQNCSHRNDAKNNTLEDIGAHSNKPSAAQAWGYGIGFVTVINLISNVGAFMLPIMHKDYFKRVLMFMVSLAVGSMSATSILVLTPEAYDLMNDIHTMDDYLWKAGTLVITIYAFFLTERLIAVTTELRRKLPQKTAEKELLDDFTKSKPDQELQLLSSGKNQEKSHENQNGVAENHVDYTDEEKHGHSHAVTIEEGDMKGQVTSLALMLLTGDGIHKTMDGLAIGVAFTENVLLGVSVSLAILSEELPHELGDIAVLLHSGLSVKRSFIYNCFASLFSYVGLVVGILLGENTNASRWIFAMAGGMFLYVSLVILLPEVNKDANSKESKRFGVFKVFLIQNAGMVSGFVIIFLITYFIGQIQLE